MFQFFSGVRKEKALRKQYGVRTQSTLIAFRGNTETGRLAGDTVGVAILFGGDKWLEAQITQHLPDAWVSLTTQF